METKDFPLKLKALEDSGAFEGLASPYGDPPDLVGDIIMPGAFTKTIADQGRGIPILWSHRQDEPLGTGVIEDSTKGLIVHGQLVMEDPVAKRAMAHMKAGSMKGLSIGFTIPGANGAEYKDGVRYLKQIRLHEVSVVAMPAAPRAQVTTVKSLGDVSHVLRMLSRGDPPDAETIEQLRALDVQLKSLLDRSDSVSREVVDALKRLQAAFG